MTTVLLARHGETEWNVAQRFQGQCDSPLSERGQAQARALCQRLALMSIDAVYASDLGRAIATAGPIAEMQGLPLRTSPALREKNYGEWEGRRRTEIETLYPDDWNCYFVQRDIHTPVPGGETWPEVAERTIGFLKDVLAVHGPDQTILIVGHGASLRPVILHALGAPIECLTHLSIDNAALTTLRFSSNGGHGRVLTLNDTCHLDGLL